jgi:hypothetical protein
MVKVVQKRSTGDLRSSSILKLKLLDDLGGVLAGGFELVGFLASQYRQC